MKAREKSFVGGDLHFELFEDLSSQTTNRENETEIIAVYRLL